MAREDWGSWLAQFATDWEKTQISAKEWCESKKLKWGTAKEFITIKAAKELLKNKQSEIPNSGKNPESRIPNSGKIKVEKKSGRPSSYLPEVAEDICNLLISGESLRSICKRPGMPNPATVMRWLSDREEFREQYACAREMQTDLIVEEALEILDNADGDSSSQVAKAKNQYEGRKWFVTKLAPKKYGDRTTQETNDQQIIMHNTLKMPGSK